MESETTGIRAFRRSLRSLEREVERSLAAETVCCGVTPAQCHLILEVEEAGEPSVGDLADALELDASTLSRTVDRLVRTGLLLRREDPENRRRQLVSLSAAGREKTAAINALCDEYYRGLLDGMPARDAEAAVRILPRLAAAMGERRRARASAPAAGPTGCCGPAANAAQTGRRP